MFDSDWDVFSRGNIFAACKKPCHALPFLAPPVPKVKLVNLARNQQLLSLSPSARERERETRAFLFIEILLLPTPTSHPPTTPIWDVHVQQSRYGGEREGGSANISPSAAPSLGVWNTRRESPPSPTVLIIIYYPSEIQHCFLLKLTAITPLHLPDRHCRQR